ncbi:MAG: family efflux transporter [Herbinix sp.]|jgi:putative MATE family efflux protein|nr:family efflux transporter [Herbinix sp.]
MTNELTTGKPMKILLKFSLPILIGNIVQQFYYLMDSIIVGRFLGVDALAAIGSTGSVTFLFMGWIMGMTGGFSILIAQRFGANDTKGLKHFVAMSYYLCIIMAVFLTLVLLLANQWILTVMNTPAEIFHDTYRFMRVVYTGITATIAYNMFNSILWALGDSKTPLYFLLISSILNILLDLLFVAVLPFGVAGAGYATVVSQITASVLCFIYMLRKYPMLRLGREDAKISGTTIRQLIKIGGPMGMQFSITAIGGMVVQMALNGLGPIYIAAFSASGKIQNIIVQAFPSLGVSLAAYVGQNTGAGRNDRVKEGVRAAVIITLICSIVAMLFVFIFGAKFADLFVDDSSGMVYENAKIFFYVVAAFYPLLGLLYLYRNALQGLGDGFVPLLGGVCELIARITVIILLLKPFGYLGICWANPVAWILALLPLVFTYYNRMRTQGSERAHK